MREMSDDLKSTAEEKSKLGKENRIEKGNQSNG